MKKVQESVAKVGDQILGDLSCKSQEGIQGISFIGNEKFLRTISRDTIGFLQEPENKFSIEDYSLDLVTPVTNLKPNAEVKCKIVTIKPGVEIAPMTVSLLKDVSNVPMEVSVLEEVCEIPHSDLPLFSVPVKELGKYEVHAMMQGRHLRGSPLCLPLSSDSAASLSAASHSAASLFAPYDQSRDGSSAFDAAISGASLPRNMGHIMTDEDIKNSSPIK